ncbi:GH92 family glycosyl hydrolase [Carboxylicivirga caseinilyticus]|uniref:GH92 family glycosyl hydrolase n=1 Tax=Carboxylicivirga caseinilyticus TaxID=3417572 RepID=UPI003D33F9B3|nr:GH92 family glycosyl hydrolase [Marinilabiliaceae bacterium A049]
MIFLYKYYSFRIIGILVYLFFVSACVTVGVDNKPENQYIGKVYPLLDTENSRWFYFSSASRPFGMVNLSPDTEIAGAWGSGYRYKVDTIKGFSHIHAWQLAGPSVMPVNDDAGFKDYFSAFSHQKEEITPGYHKVYLERYNIEAELTSTKRVGFHRYQLKNTNKLSILFNLNGELGPSLMKDGLVFQSADKQRIIGQVTNSATIRRPKDCTVYFIADFSLPVDTIEKDIQTGNYKLSFKDIEGGSLLMKLAVSYTSAENAAINMKTELPGWDFDQIVKESADEWNQILSRIKIEGGTAEQQKRFYTDLWHALQGRRIISDVNGAYPDNTGDEFRIGQLPLDENGKPKFNHYNSDSFWGAQWTINTLWGLVFPDVVDEFTQSLLQYHKDGGLIPRGPSGGNYTYVMTGASSTPFIVSAIQKGIVKDSLEAIYEALKKNHMGGLMEKAGYEHATNLGGGLSYYMQEGYIPYPLSDIEYGSHQDGVSQTLEYAYQDWSLAQLAKKLGYDEDEKYFIQRSKNYQNLYDSISGWMRPKDKQGLWKSDFDPYQLESGFIEANAAQVTWFVPHDLNGLAHLMGGNEKAAEKLNQSFIEAEKMGFTAGTSHDREAHPEYSRIPINYGNQPSIQTAFIFNYLEQPWLTQYWSRKVVEAVYEGLSTERGYNGDEDQGLMGSLAVLMKMGLFSMKGGCSMDPQLELGSPIFDKVIIQLNQKYYPGKELIIETSNNSAQNAYISKATWKGTKLMNWSILQSELVKGGTLHLEMSDHPDNK